MVDSYKGSMSWCRGKKKYTGAAGEFALESSKRAPENGWKYVFEGDSKTQYCPRKQIASLQFVHNCCITLGHVLVCNVTIILLFTAHTIIALHNPKLGALLRLLNFTYISKWFAAEQLSADSQANARCYSAIRFHVSGYANPLGDHVRIACIPV